MKKLYVVMAAAVVISVLTSFILDTTGYQQVSVGAGTLYAKAQGNSKDVVVLFLAGSGPTDMDGNSPYVRGRTDSYRMLAQGLNDAGISTFRFDKRTAGKSAQTFNLSEMNFNMFVDDAVAVIQHLKESGYERIIIAGHSKGSLVGMLAALKEPVDGFISIGGTGLPIDLTLEKQLLQQYPENSKEIQIIRQLREGKTDPSMSDDHSLFSFDKQKFWLTWMQHDPAQIIAQLDIPSLVIHGQADLQVDSADYEAFKTDRKNVAYLELGNMNHVMKKVYSDEQNIASYNDPSFPLHDKLIPPIKDFINIVINQ